MKAALISGACAIAAALIAGTVAVAGYGRSDSPGQGGGGTPGPPTVSASRDALAEDPELARFAIGFRDAVHDCVQSHPDTYLHEVGLTVPKNTEAKGIVRCYGNGWAAYFVTFSDFEARGYLFNELSSINKINTGECQSWGWGLPLSGPPAGETAQARVCFKAGNGVSLGIYWEPAEDTTKERRFAGVLVARETDSESLKRVWEAGVG